MGGASEQAFAYAAEGAIARLINNAVRMRLRGCFLDGWPIRELYAHCAVIFWLYFYRCVNILLEGVIAYLEFSSGTQ